MRKYFDTYKEAKYFMEKIGEEKVVNYGKITTMGEMKCYVEYEKQKKEHKEIRR